MADMKLRECPHCGENCADIVVNQGDKWAHYEAGCLEVRTGYIMDEDATWRNKAIKAWNTRTTDSTIEAQEAEIKRLREALEYIEFASNFRCDAYKGKSCDKNTQEAYEESLRDIRKHVREILNDR